MSSTTGNFLKQKRAEWRRKTGGNQKGFAAFLGLKPTTVSNWINGEFEPDLNSLAKIAERYPDVYDVIDIPGRKLDPSEMAVVEAWRATQERIQAKGITLESPEGIEIFTEELRKSISKLKPF